MDYLPNKILSLHRNKIIFLLSAIAITLICCGYVLKRTEISRLYEKRDWEGLSQRRQEITDAAIADELKFYEELKSHGCNHHSSIAECHTDNTTSINECKDPIQDTTIPRTRAFEISEHYLLSGLKVDDLKKELPCLLRKGVLSYTSPRTLELVAQIKKATDKTNYTISDIPGQFTTMTDFRNFKSEVQSAYDLLYVLDLLKLSQNEKTLLTSYRSLLEAMERLEGPYNCLFNKDQIIAQYRQKIRQKIENVKDAEADRERKLMALAGKYAVLRGVIVSQLSDDNGYWYEVRLYNGVTLAILHTTNTKFESQGSFNLIVSATPTALPDMKLANGFTKTLMAYHEAPSWARDEILEVDNNASEKEKASRQIASLDTSMYDTRDVKELKSCEYLQLHLSNYQEIRLRMLRDVL